MLCYAYLNIKDQIENFKYERGLNDDEIFMYAFPQGIIDEDYKKIIQKQVIILLDNKNDFARVFIDGDELFEIASPNNKFFIDLNNRKISINENDYL